MNNKLTNDQALIRAYEAGDEKAFEELIGKYKNKVYTTILLIVKDQYLAEDLLQETFIKAVFTIRSGKYNEEGKFLPWISRIAHNIAIDYFRKQKRNPTQLIDDGTVNLLNQMVFAEENFEAKHMKQETLEKLRQQIEQLPDVQREVLIMRHYMEMTFHEIADATGVSINTALGRMRYALMNLRKKMDQSEKSYARENPTE
jgi:RNA polymerase sigma-70 factor (ECF subfamily)